MDWHKKIDEGINQGLDVSKKVLDKAKKKAKKLGDQSLLAFEIKELEKENTRLIKELGNAVYTLFVDSERSSITSRTAEIKPLLKKLQEVKDSLIEKKSFLDTE